MRNSALRYDKSMFEVSSRILARALMLMAVIGALASCSGVADTTNTLVDGVADTTRTVVENLNPVNWFGNDKDEKVKKPLASNEQDVKPKAFPKLGSVPLRPKKRHTEAKTKQIAKGLAADTENARYSDQQLRQSTSVFGGNPRPPGAARPSRKTVGPKKFGNVVSPSVKRAGATQVTKPISTPSRSGIVPPPLRPPAAVMAPKSRVRGNIAPPAPMKRPARAKVSPPPLIALPPPVKAPRTRAGRATANKTAGSKEQSVAFPKVKPIGTRTTVTPVGRPIVSPKPPPVATPLGGPMSQRAVSLQPPAVARVSRSPEPKQVGERSMEQPKSVLVGTIYFGDGSSRLSSEDTSILRAVSDVFRQTGGKVRVIGHSSMGAQVVGSIRRESVNYRMSLKRANAVADELIRQGVPAASVEVIAQGDSAPVYAETTQTGAAYNRRAEVFIDYLERS